MKEMSTHQASLMFMVATFSTKLLALPALISQIALNDLCWVFLFNFLIEGIFFIFFIYIMKSNPDLTFKELISKSLGKTFSKILFLLLAIYFILKAIIVAEESYILFDDTIYVAMDKILYAFVLLILISYTSTIRLRSFGRLIEIIFFILLFSIGLSILMSFGDLNLSELLPIMVNGPMPVFKAMYTYCFWFGDFMLFYYLLGNIKMSKHTVSSIISGWAFGCLISLLIAGILYCTFSVTTPIHIEAITEISEYMPKLSTETRFNWIVAFIFPYALYYTISLFVRFSHESFLFVFNDTKKKFLISMLILAIVIVILILSNITYQNLKEFLTGWFNYIIIAIQYGVPILLPISYLIYTKKKKQTKQEEKASW